MLHGASLQAIRFSWKQWNWDGSIVSPFAQRPKAKRKPVGDVAMLVLDTDHLSALEWRDGDQAKRLRDRMRRSSEVRVTTIVTYEEQCRGWLAYIKRANSVDQEIDAYERLANHLKFFLNVTVLDYNRSAAMTFRELKTGVSIGPMDLKIAAIVLAQNATLLSRNLKDFEKVP